MQSYGYKNSKPNAKKGKHHFSTNSIAGKLSMQGKTPQEMHRFLMSADADDELDEIDE